MKKALLLLLLPIMVQAAEPITLPTAYCYATGDCATDTKRRNAAIAWTRVQTSCVTGFESNCTATVGQVYNVEIWEQGSTAGHLCWNFHYAYEVGTIAIIDPFSGASGVSFIAAIVTLPHCTVSSGQHNCGNEQ